MRTALSVMVLLLPAGIALADTTINVDDKYAYGANVGWINCRGDVPDGAVVGEFICSGYLWGANIGWIHLGDGTPQNGHQYANGSASDFGVNHAGLGRLRGYAYGANVGWITFEDQGNARCDLSTGNLSGYAYGANIGWISLSNQSAFVRTDSMEPATSGDGDTIADPWEYKFTNVLTALYDGHDADDDGVNDEDEETADTNPLDGTDYLRISAVGVPDSTNTDVSWPSRATRLYSVDHATTLTGTPSWTDSALGTFEPDGGTSTTRRITEPSGAKRFYRVKAHRPTLP